MWYDDNPLWNRFATMQGVEIGSPGWLAAGIAPYSHQTGPQPSYGHNFAHLTDDRRKLEVLSRYASHGVFYTGAFYRTFNSGRPRDWAVEEHGREGIDTEEGGVDWGGDLEVFGPDVQHAHFRPLVAVIDAESIGVQTPFGSMSSDLVAHILFTYHLRALFGQIRVPGQGDGFNTFDWGHRDRGNACLLTAMTDGLKRKALEMPDAQTASRFFLGPFLRVYETGPGVEFFSRSRPGPNDPYPVGVYNSLSWVLAAMSDAQRYKHFPERARLRAIIERFSQWFLDLEVWTLSRSYLPGAAFQAEKFILPPGLKSPPASIHALIQNVDGLDDDPGTRALRRAWGYKACRIALETLGPEKAPELVAAEAAIRTEHIGNPDTKKWLVGPDNAYVEA